MPTLDLRSLMPWYQFSWSQRRQRGQKKYASRSQRSQNDFKKKVRQY